MTFNKAKFDSLMLALIVVILAYAAVKGWGTFKL